MIDWMKEIRSFPRIDPSAAGLPLPDREAAEAAARYNRALAHLQGSGADIACIELRKLCATTPSFGVAHVLLGCGQMLQGNPISANRTFRKAGGIPLPDDLRLRLAEYAEEAAHEAAASGTIEEVDGLGAEEARAALLDARSMGGLVRPSNERGRTVRVAKQRERRQALSAADAAKKREEAELRPKVEGSTRSVTHGAPAGPVPRRLLVPIAALLLVAVLVAGGILGIPPLLAALGASGASPTPDAASRLQWILDAIDELHDQGKPIPEDLRAILEKFNEEFPESAVSIPPDPTASPVPPTPTSSAPTDADRLADAAASVAAAEGDIAQSHYGNAYDALAAAKAVLAGLPGGTTADGVAGTAADALDRASSLLSSIEPKACDEWRRAGVALFEAGDPTDALPTLLKVYQLRPNFYSGGVAYYVGRCYEALGRKDEARACYQYVVAHFPTKDVAAYSQWHLDHLG